MKRKHCLSKCCIYALILALVAGIFGYWLNTTAKDYGDNGVLVKNISKEEKI